MELPVMHKLAEEGAALQQRLYAHSDYFSYIIPSTWFLIHAVRSSLGCFGIEEGLAAFADEFVRWIRERPKHGTTSVPRACGPRC